MSACGRGQSYCTVTMCKLEMPQNCLFSVQLFSDLLGIVTRYSASGLLSWIQDGTCVRKNGKSRDEREIVEIEKLVLRLVLNFTGTHNSHDQLELRVCL